MVFPLSSIRQATIAAYKRNYIITLFKNVEIVIVFIKSPRGFGGYIDGNTVVVAFNIHRGAIQIDRWIVRREFQFHRFESPRVNSTGRLVLKRASIETEIVAIKPFFGESTGLRIFFHIVIYTARH